MTPEELTRLREDLLHHNSDRLRQLYLQHKQGCMALLIAKMKVTQTRAEDVFTDALLVFRQNVITRKIEKLSSVKAYLNSTCINMVKEGWNYEKRRRKKEDAVRLLFYEKNHVSTEERKRLAELDEICQEALGAISERCREILIAFYVYKIPMKEIAEEYGFASGDVAKMTKSRCYKAWMREVNKIVNEKYAK